jgi:hypothetical protein
VGQTFGFSQFSMCIAQNQVGAYGVKNGAECLIIAMP